MIKISNEFQIDIDKLITAMNRKIMLQKMCVGFIFEIMKNIKL